MDYSKGYSRKAIATLSTTAAVVAMSLFCLSSVLGQPNTKRSKFGGTWVYNFKESDGTQDQKGVYKGQDLVITYVEPKLTIIQSRTLNGGNRSATLIFFTDGRGEKNRPFAFKQGVEVDSITKWHGDKLIRKYKLDVYMNGKVVGAIEHDEEYSLSSDGQVLKIIDESFAYRGAGFSPISVAPGSAKEVRVYGRKT